MAADGREPPGEVAEVVCRCCILPLCPRILGNDHRYSLTPLRLGGYNNRYKTPLALTHPWKMPQPIGLGLQYPIFGPEIQCPHCRQTIAALTLTDTYLCHRHGAFEADPKTGDLVHLQSGRSWRLWNEEWYRQHTHPDGIRFEIHEALDRLYTQGYRATKVIIAHRYRELVSAYLERNSPWQAQTDATRPRLYGLPVEFSPEAETDPRWDVINFDIDKEPGSPVRYPYFRLFE